MFHQTNIIRISIVEPSHKCSNRPYRVSQEAENSPLHVALLRGNTSIVRMLLHAKASADSIDKVVQ